MAPRSTSRYGAVTQALHWTTAILVVVAFAYGLGGSEQHVYSGARDFKRQVHESLGMCVFALTLVRVLWKMVDRPPELLDTPRWMQIAAKGLQGFLYLLLFMVPLTAIAGAWLEGHSLTFIGNITFAPMLMPSHEVGAAVAELHTWLGDAILWLAGAHAFAALYHHVVLKDGVLLTMLPAWLASSSVRAGGGRRSAEH